MGSNYEVRPGKGIDLYGGNLAFFKSKNAECILAGPADTGKTFALCLKVHLCACKYPRAAIALVRKTQTSCYNTVVRTFMEHILGPNVSTWPCVPYGGTNRPERFNYHNGSVVFITGLDKPSRLLSAEFDLIAVSQAEELTLPDWETLTTRATGRADHMPYAQCVGDCNPAYPLHWIKIRSKGGPLVLIESTHKDNPILYNQATGEITDEGICRIGRLDELTGIRLMRLRKGLWATAEGVVYDIFDPPVHVREREPSEFKAWYLAMDEGYTNPAVILLIGEDEDGRAHIAREFYETGKLQSDIVATAAAWYSEWQCSAAIVDAAGAGLIAALRDAGLPATGAKGRVNDGIHVVQDLLKVQGDGRPRLTVDPACVNVVNEFESYIWKPERDEPVKDNDHAADALRYYAVTRASRGRSGIWV